jgi:peptide/nickel transport system permease protein
MFKALRRSPYALIGLVIIVVLLATAVLAPIFLTGSATEVNILDGNRGPSAAHLLGTDNLGRDIFSRVAVATRLTLQLSLEAVALGALAGIPVGAACAVAPPRVRLRILRVIDATIAFPTIIVAILASIVLRPGPQGATIGVAIATAFTFARLSSSLSMSIGALDYVHAARVIGVRPSRVLGRYILPNIADTMLIASTVAVAGAIVAISSLSFLGLGVQAPNFDWGALLTAGIEEIYVNPWAAVGPALAIAVAAIAFGFVGEALAHAMNPIHWTDHGSRRLAGQPARSEAIREAQAQPIRDAAACPENAILEVRDLRVSFPAGHGEIDVVDGVSFWLKKAEMLGIVGESGSGKTMTAMALLQLVSTPGRVHGAVISGGDDLLTLPRRGKSRLMARTFAVVFQDPMSSLNPAVKIGLQMVESVRFHQRIGRSESTRMALGRLRQVRLANPDRLLRSYAHELSGGMRQRTMIAMGLTNRPKVLVADEPTTALDVTIQAQVMELLRTVNIQEEMAVILISHNLGLVQQNCNRLAVMYAGRIVETLPTEDLVRQARHPYTRALLDSVPDAAHRRGQRLPFIPGQPPDPAQRPPGCAFHPRCPLVEERCRSEAPPIVARDADSSVACWVANRDL